MTKRIFSLCLCALAVLMLHAQRRIINGTPVMPPAFEWMAGLSYSSDPADHFCGGMLIADQWVMTAAHCVEGEQAQDVHVFFKAYYLTFPLGSTVAIQADSLIQHPDYDYNNSDDHDIALVHLAQPVSIEPVMLPHPGDDYLVAPGRLHTVLGWGATDTLFSWGSDTLLKAIVPIVDDSICNLPFAYDGEVSGNMLCAGYMAGGTDACTGDSGGPLVTMEDNHWYATGIVSWGYGCASPNLPGIYTKVMNYYNWIRTHVDSLPQPVGMQEEWARAISTTHDGQWLAVTSGGNIHIRNIQLLTVNGTVAEETEAGAGEKILLSLQHLARGIYLARILTDKGVVIKKIML